MILDDLERPIHNLTERMLFKESTRKNRMKIVTYYQWQQEAQLPQRNSASATHVEEAKPSSPLPLPPLATPMRTVESETRNKRTPSVPSVKRTLS